MSNMTLDELINALEEIRDNRGDDIDAPVRVAYQPGWPLRGVVKTVAPAEEIDGSAADDSTVWLAVDQVDSWGENPYAPGNIW